MADRFYTFRNHIIHGEKIRDKLFRFYGQPHYHLALWFFLVCVKQIINKALNKDIFFDTIRCESGKFVYDEQSFEAAFYEAVKTCKGKRTK